MNDDFANLMDDDVKPLRVEKRFALDKTQAHVSQDVRRQAATQEEQNKEDPLSSLPAEMLDPLDVLDFRRTGVQHGVYKNLRMGRYTLDARLDLHRLTVDQARKSLYEFVQDCIQHDVRAALVTHGKGIGREKPALLKSCVAYWLPEMPEVLAFHTAQKHHGGYGATYVLLKKSDKKKQETREKHQRREPI